MITDPVTREMAKHYRAHPTSFAFRVIARNFKTTTAVVYGRLWRAGVVPRRGHALYYTDEEIAQAYLQRGSLAAVAEELGISFYVVKDALRRQGVTPTIRRRVPQVSPAQVLDTIARLRPDVEWKDIAQRLGITPQTLWKYRTRLTSTSEVRGHDDATRSPGSGSARSALHSETRRNPPEVGLRVGRGGHPARHPETVGGHERLSNRG